MTTVQNLKICVVIPAYNEELTIDHTLKAFFKVIPNATLMVINNHSSDTTEILAQKTIDQLGAKGKIINEWRQGKGYAVRRAFSDVDADIYVLVDADMTYPAEKIFELIQPIMNNDADMVVADRISENQYANQNTRRFHNFGNRLVKRLVNDLFSSDLKDIMSGYRSFSKRFVKNYPILVPGFQLETDMTIHALNMRLRILEIPMAYKNRPAGSVSKLNTIKDGAQVLSTIFRLFRYYKPLSFFSILSLFFLILGFIIAIPVFKGWIFYHTLEHVPLAVLAAILEMISLMMLGVGLILDPMAHYHNSLCEKLMLNRVD